MNQEKTNKTTGKITTSDIPATDKERNQKEDKRDSRKIAKSLQNQELYVAPFGSNVYSVMR